MISDHASLEPIDPEAAIRRRFRDEAWGFLRESGYSREDADRILDIIESGIPHVIIKWKETNHD